MQVSVETTQGLERKISVTLPAEDFNTALEARLKQIAKTVKMPGFRPGKVPFNTVKQQYTGEATQDVLGDLIQNTLFKAISEQDFQPAGYPQVQSTDLSDAGELTYTATFEVYPEITLADPKAIKVDKPEASVGDKDIDAMVENLLKQRAQWHDVDRASKDGDQVNANFVGKIDGEAFEGGKGENVPITLGSGSMIPGFEEQIVGMKAGDEKTIDVTFPADYGKEDLQNKPAQFDIKVNAVQEQTLPEKNEEFFKTYGAKDEADLRENLVKHMNRELEHKLKTETKRQVMDGLLEINEIDVPSALVKQEIQQLKQQAMQQFGQNAPIKFEDIPDEPFQEEAQRRVKLGLIVGEVIKQQELKVDEEKVDQTIQDMASTYDDPEQVVEYYKNTPQARSNIESVVLEDSAVDYLLSKAKVTDKAVSFEEAMQFGQQQ